MVYEVKEKPIQSYRTDAVLQSVQADTMRVEDGMLIFEMTDPPRVVMVYAPGTWFYAFEAAYKEPDFRAQRGSGTRHNKE